jgi:hypothetical protein
VSRRAPAGRTLPIGVASICAAALGWGTLTVVGRLEGPATYASFAVLWATFYAAAGVLAGLQQEVTRSATRSAPGTREPGPRVLGPALASGAFVTGIVAATAPWWTPAAGVGWAAAAWLCWGLLGLTVLVTLAGLAAATGQWWLVAALLVTDPFARAVAVGVVVAGGGGGASYAAAVAVGGWSWAVLLASPAARRALLIRASTGNSQFLSRAAAGMVSTGCAALLVSGYAFLVALTARDPLVDTEAGLLAALVVLRSPLLVLVYGYRPVILNGLLVSSVGPRRRVARVWLWAVALGAVASVAAGAFGPWGLELVFGAGFDLTRVQAAVLVLNAVMITMLVYSGLALVAVDSHGANSIGWVLGVIGTAAVLLTLSDNADRMVGGLVVGPLLALAWHGFVWVRRGPSVPASLNRGG